MKDYCFPRMTNQAEPKSVSSKEALSKLLLGYNKHLNSKSISITGLLPQPKKIIMRNGVNLNGGSSMKNLSFATDAKSFTKVSFCRENTQPGQENSAAL